MELSNRLRIPFYSLDEGQRESAEILALSKTQETKLQQDEVSVQSVMLNHDMDQNIQNMR